MFFLRRLVGFTELGQPAHAPPNWTDTIPSVKPR
jgi:hypothetical protein